nr:sulfotransferase [uncultured Cohaesibacter sp.]
MQQKIDKLFETAANAQSKEKYKVAFNLYRGLFELSADHPEANFKMGDLAVAIGKPEQALAFFEAALRRTPTNLLFWISYIGALSQLGMIGRAKQMLTEAETLGLDETSIFTLKKLLVETTRALKCKTNILESTSLSQATKSAARMVKEGKNKQAISIYIDILEKFPQNRQALSGLEKLAPMDVNRSAMIPREPPKETVEKVQKLLQDGKFHSLIKLNAQLLHDYPDSISINTAEGTARRALLQYDLALESFNKVLKVNPESANTYFNIGVCYLELHDIEAAEKNFKAAIKIDENLPEVYRHWVYMKKMTHQDEIFSKMEKIYKESELSINQRSNLCFALAKAYEDTKNFEESFQYLSEGNALRKEYLKYDISQDEELFEKIYEWNGLVETEKLQLANQTIGFAPIFILGMPRSGTSLVEQILSSHSMVGAAGEFPYISNFSNSVIHDIVQPSRSAFEEFAKTYETGARRITNNEHYITDKFPLNFKYINIIFTLFPNAKIINTNRDARAVCWSNFKQYFANDGLGYTYNIEDTVAYYKMYKKLMQFWYEKFGNRIYNLNYDRLVSNQEEETRKLADYVGLDWQDAMLAPHKNKRIVKTASINQVRKAVYKGSSDKWRAFAPFLETYFSKLDD